MQERKTMLLMTRRDALKAGAAGLGVLAARGAAAEPTRVVTDHLGRRVTLPLRTTVSYYY